MRSLHDSLEPLSLDMRNNGFRFFHDQNEKLKLHCSKTVIFECKLYSLIEIRAKKKNGRPIKENLDTSCLKVKLQDI